MSTVRLTTTKMLNKIALALVLVAGGALHAIAAPADSTDVRRNEIPRIVTATGGALVLNGAVTEILKHNVHEMRPDRESNNSFPSRHTSWVFAISTAASTQLYRHSPWWVAGTHTVASAVALQRVAARRHWGGDVIMGATIGIVTAEGANLISRAIFGGQSPLVDAPECSFRTTFAVTSTAFFNVGSPKGYDFCTGWSTSWQLRVPLYEHWGVTTSMGAMSMPVKYFGGIAALSGIELTAGLCAHRTLGKSPFAVTGALQTGIIKWAGRHEARPAQWGVKAVVDGGVEWRLTDSFGMRVSAAYNLSTCCGAVSALTLGLSSLVVF